MDEWIGGEINRQTDRWYMILIKCHSLTRVSGLCKQLEKINKKIANTNLSSEFYINIIT